MKDTTRVPASLASALAALSVALPAQAGALSAQTGAELAGRSLAQFPHFEHVKAFHEGAPVELAVNPVAHPALVGQTCDLYVVASQTPAQWSASPALVDLTAAVETVTFSALGIQANTYAIDGGTLSGDAGVGLGVGYDVVVDVDRDGLLGAVDLIDGYDAVESGLYVCRDTAAPGPSSVVELTYDLSAASFDAQNAFYPSDVASLGALPLVVVSHGNGQNYQWYDHVGAHLASYGFVVVSHQSNTGPGPASAAVTTLSNTDAFLGALATIGGGVLQGHVDTTRIVWLGQGRGGEGVVVAYDMLFDGAYVPQHFGIDDVRLISSIGPSDLLGPASADPHGVSFHLWGAGSDVGLSGCADCDACQPFQLHDRAERFRQSTYLHGAAYGSFHNGGGVASGVGPCLLSVAEVHAVLRGYLLPLVERYTAGNVPAKDFLTRQWEAFRPIGAPTSPCVVVDLTYRDGDMPGRIVVDDYQANPALGVASSGLPVAFSVTNAAESELDDANATFTDDPFDAMNGMTLSGDGADDSAGVVFEWNAADAYYAWIAPGGSGAPLSLWKTISFRACQVTRDALTTTVLGDLTFDVTVLDTNLNFARINVGAFGGGVEEPYQRAGCGAGVGWANEFETIRVPIAAFRHDNPAIDLDHVLAFGFEFGPAHGSARGRIGIDDVEVLID